jgi:hypothetical protein
MTPEKLLDYSVKFGVLPFMIYMVFITRQDLKETRIEVVEMRSLLIDCYQDKTIVPKGLTGQVLHKEQQFAILPDKRKKICFEI